MKTISSILAIALLATVAFGAESSAGPLASHWTNIPSIMVDYWLQPFDFLISVFWKWIMYGTFYVAVEQVLCNFFYNLLDTLVWPTLSLTDFVSTITADELKAACFSGFKTWYDMQFYYGGYNDRPFYLG